MREIRCSACDSFLCEINNGIVVVKGKNEIEVKPAGSIRATCKCGKVNVINATQQKSFHERLHFNGNGTK